MKVKRTLTVKRDRAIYWRSYSKDQEVGYLADDQLRAMGLPKRALKLRVVVTDVEPSWRSTLTWWIIVSASDASVSISHRFVTLRFCREAWNRIGLPTNGWVSWSVEAK